MGGKCIEHKVNDKSECSYCGRKLLVVDKEVYEYLQKQAEILEFLEALGVDNWSGYRTPPDREDYDTDEEYEDAYEKALSGYW